MDWFFVLSGFLLAAGLWHQPINTASTLHFWQRRVVRIYPGAWVHLWVLMLSLYGLGFLTAIPWGQLAINMTLWVVPMPFGAQRLNDVFWTLPLELCFYLSLPFWIWLQRKIGTVPVVLWALAITLVWRFGVIWAHENGHDGPGLGYVRYSYPGILFVFMAGFAINHFTQNNTPTLSDRQRWLMLAVVWMAYYLWLKVLVNRRGEVPNTDWLLTLWELGAAALIAVLLALMLRPLKGLGWLASKPLVWLGEISFGIYLWHFPIFRLMPKLMPGTFTTALDCLWALAIGLSLTLVLAWASFKWVEQPLIRACSKAQAQPS